MKLVAAAAAARQGDLDTARRLAEEASRELMALGFSDAASLGEARTQLELQAALQRADGRGASRHDAVGDRTKVAGSSSSVSRSRSTTAGS